MILFYVIIKLSIIFPYLSLYGNYNYNLWRGVTLQDSFPRDVDKL